MEINTKDFNVIHLFDEQNQLVLENKDTKELFSIPIDNQLIEISNLNNIQEEQPSKQPDGEWGTAETKLLLDKYELYLPLVGPMKKFKTKKVMWKKIAEDIKNILQITKSELQCENRYKTILKRKKKVSDNNHTSGSCRQIIQFEEELKKISAIDDSIEPEVSRGVNKTTHKRPIEEVHSETSEEESVTPAPEIQAEQKSKGMDPPPTKKGKNICETLALLHKDKEDNKERRHKEKLDVLKNLIEALKKDK